VKHLALLMLVAVALGGCVTTGKGLSATTRNSVCEAIGPPHVYNSKDKNSKYHAGTKVSPRLARDNRVGTALGCPGY
jgi:hypothetical protein